MLTLPVNNIQESKYGAVDDKWYDILATSICKHKVGGKKVVPEQLCCAKKSLIDSPANEFRATISKVRIDGSLKSFQALDSTSYSTSLCEIVIQSIPSREIKGMVSTAVIEKATHSAPAMVCATGEDKEMSNSLDDDVPDEFCCPISFEFLREPAIAKGENRMHRVELEMLHDWVAAHGTNPLTMLPMSTKDIVVDILLKEKISSWLARHPKHHATAQQEAAAAKAASIKRIWHEPIQALLAAGNAEQGFHLSNSGKLMAGSSPDADVRTYSRSVWREDGLSKRQITINEAANFAKMSNGHIPAVMSFNKVKYVILHAERIRSDAILIRAMAPKGVSLAVISTKKGSLVGVCQKFNFANMCIDLEKIVDALRH